MSDAILSPYDLSERIDSPSTNEEPMPMVEPDVIATYVRVSTEDQDVKMQRTFIERLMLTHGILFEDAQHFEDDGVSATIYPSLDDRQAGRELMKLIRSGTVNKLFVFRLDRLFRETEAAMSFIKEMMKHKVQLFSSDFTGEITSPDGRFAYGLQMLLSERESGVLSVRVKGAMSELMEDLKPVSKIPPYGWNYLENDVGEKIVRPNWKEQSVIDWVFEQTESNKKIADKLNDRNVPSKTGGKWSAASIWRMKNEPPKYQSQLSRFKVQRKIKYPFRALQVK